MTELVRLLDRRFASVARLIEIAQETQVPREISERGDQGVIDVERRVELAVRGVKSGKPLLQMRAGGQEFTEIEAGRPTDAVARPCYPRVCALLAPLQKFSG